MKLLRITVAMLFSACLSPLVYANEDISICKAGWAETESGNHSRAVELFNQCIEKGNLTSASLARTYRNIGIAYRRNSQAELAIPYYDKSLALNPTDPWSDYINKGNAYSEIEMYEEALKEYVKAEQANPNYGEVQYNRGIVYERQGKAKMAAAEFKKAMDMGLRTQLLYERLVAYKLIVPAQ